MDPEAFKRYYQDVFQRAQQQNSQTWWSYVSEEPMDPKQEVIVGLCYGAVYNKFPELELWDREKRIALSQENKDKVVEYLKVVYKYYSEKYKDYKPYVNSV